MSWCHKTEPPKRSTKYAEHSAQCNQQDQFTTACEADDNETCAVMARVNNAMRKVVCMHLHPASLCE